MKLGEVAARAGVNVETSRYDERRGAAAAAGARAERCSSGDTRQILASLRRRDRQLVDALGGDSEVVLWLEHGLYDQLQLLDALAPARGTGVCRRR